MTIQEENISRHIACLMTPEMRAFAGIEYDQDLHFQVFRIITGLSEALTRLEATQSWEQK